jgi:hypothetical protein
MDKLSKIIGIGILASSLISSVYAKERSSINYFYEEIISMNNDYLGGGPSVSNQIEENYLELGSTLIGLELIDLLKPHCKRILKNNKIPKDHSFEVGNCKVEFNLNDVVDAEFNLESELVNLNTTFTNNIENKIKVNNFEFKIDYSISKNCLIFPLGKHFKFCKYLNGKNIELKFHKSF